MRTPWNELVEQLGMSSAAREAWRSCAIAVLIILALALFGHFCARQANAQPVRAVDCSSFAGQIAVAAWARDMKADENLVAIFHRALNRELGFNLSRAIEREVRRVWQEKLPADKAVANAHRRCTETLGELGLEG